jgi:hypothetical protein
MKKTLRLTLLASVAVAALVLTSCNALLESLYPNETGHGTPSSTTYSLTVNITGTDYSSAYGWWGYAGLSYTYYATKPIYVQVYDQANVLVASQTTSFTQQYPNPAGGIRTANTTFTGLASGTYTFRIWYDMDGRTDGVWEASYADGYYYTNYVYVNDSTYASNVPVQSDTSVTAYLYEEYPY